MGYYRFILSILVVLSHSFGLIAGYNTGRIAVVCFFIVSGFVMTALIQAHYPSASLLLGVLRHFILTV